MKSAPAVAPAAAARLKPAPAGMAATRGVTRLSWPVAGVLLAAFCAIVLLAGQLNPYLGDYGDDAEFLILGQGLATGQGYAWVNTPDRPAHNRYPLGYPLLLAAALNVTGTAFHPAGAIVPAKVVTAATLFGAAALLWPLARRRLPGPWGAGAVAVFLLNPFALRFAGEVMSDVPYLPALLAALVWADRLAGPAPSAAAPEVAGTGVSMGSGWPAGARRAPALEQGVLGWVVLGILLALGAYVRSVGLAAGAGVLAWAWWRAWRRQAWPAALAATGAFALLQLPWWVRDAGLAGGWRYLEELLAAQYQAPANGTVSSADLLLRALGNVAFLAGKPGVFGAAGLLIGALAGAIVVLGYVRVLARVGGAAEWAAIALLIAVLFWPIRTGRYLLPIIPLLGIYAIAGALLLARWRPRLGRWVSSRLALRLVATGVLLFAVLEAAYAGREAMGNARAMRAGGGAAGYYAARPEWARYLEAAAWLGDNARPDDVALARRHFALYVYSGHFADKYRFDTTPDELDYLFSGTARKYVVEDAFDVLRGDFGPLPEAVRARGGDLRLRFETASPAVRVWELVRPPGSRQP